MKNPQWCLPLIASSSLYSDILKEYVFSITVMKNWLQVRPQVCFKPRFNCLKMQHVACLSVLLPFSHHNKSCCWSGNSNRDIAQVAMSRSVSNRMYLITTCYLTQWKSQVHINPPNLYIFTIWITYLWYIIIEIQTNSQLQIWQNSIQNISTVE